MRATALQPNPTNSTARTWRAARPGLRMIERFTRIDDETIDYRVTVEDPDSFTQPYRTV